MEYYSTMKRNTFVSVLIRWMNIEPIIQSEVSQKEKDKYCILTNIYMESRKMVLKNLFTGNNGETDIENRPMDMGRGEEMVRCMESVTQKLTLPYVKEIAKRYLLYSSGNSNRDSINLEGWDGMGREMGGRFRRERIYAYLWLIHVEV